MCAQTFGKAYAHDPGPTACTEPKRARNAIPRPGCRAAYTDLARYPSDLEAFYRFSTYGQILTSKFVLCPPGLGPDSYRLWEVLYLGAIPVIERTQGGWDDLLVDLPVLLVDSYEEITPEFLRETYAFILGECGTFDLRRLTKAYYLHLIRRQGTTRLGEGTTRPQAKPDKTICNLFNAMH